MERPHEQDLAVCDLRDWHAGGTRREAFIQAMGHALQDIGFFALTGHGIPIEAIDEAYRVAAPSSNWSPR